LTPGQKGIEFIGRPLETVHTAPMGDVGVFRCPHGTSGSRKASLEKAREPLTAAVHGEKYLR
jgi:hypothetical protein